jgi:mannose-1-phosphate guanylyltransferase
MNLVRDDHARVLKSLILCAGFGTRLRPLTATLPKPLATVFNTPLFDIALKACVASGATDIAINTHHLHSVMSERAKLAANALGLKALHVSHETPELLGTGGAICQLRDWWGNADLLVYNGDILSDIPLRQLVELHRASGHLVTLVVKPDPPSDGGRSIWLDEAGKVHHIAKRTDLKTLTKSQNLMEMGFACAYVASPEFSQYLPSRPEYFDIVEGFTRALTDGRSIYAMKFDGFWADIGNPRALWETNLKLAGMTTASREQILMHSTQMRADLPPTCKFDSSSVIADSAIIAPNTKISNSVLLDGASVLTGETLHNCLRGFGFNEVYT